MEKFEPWKSEISTYLLIIQHLQLCTIKTCHTSTASERRQGVGTRENRGQDGYGRRESRGREAGVVRGQEVGEPV